MNSVTSEGITCAFSPDQIPASCGMEHLEALTGLNWAQAFWKGTPQSKCCEGHGGVGQHGGTLDLGS